jgi:leader peptidase (prepilin peptidase)/N-methyltransferase
MVAIAVIDLRSYVIPDALTAAGFGLAVVHAVAQEPDAMVNAVLLVAVRASALALLFWAFRAVYAWIRGRQGLGLGDVKLAGVAGAWLDWSLISVAVELAAVAALSSYALRQYILGRPISVTNRMPFGLFFAPAIWACWVLETLWLTPF